MHQKTINNKKRSSYLEKGENVNSNDDTDEDVEDIHCTRKRNANKIYKEFKTYTDFKAINFLPPLESILLTPHKIWPP